MFNNNDLLRKNNIKHIHYTFITSILFLKFKKKEKQYKVKNVNLGIGLLFYIEKNILFLHSIENKIKTKQ